MLQRVQKILASVGISSRRDCEKLIEQGRVRVNDNIIKLGDKAELGKDKIYVDNQLVKLVKKIYIMLNKPRGYISSTSEQVGQKVIDLVRIKQRIFPVGRLDKDTEGLLIMTNDGDFANRIMHPRYEVEKEYEVILNKPFDKKDLDKLKDMYIENRRVDIRNIKIISEKKLIITIHEGRKHIIKKVFRKLGYFVSKLIRVRINNLRLNIPAGNWRFLNNREIIALTSPKSSD